MARTKKTTAATTETVVATNVAQATTGNGRSAASEAYILAKAATTRTTIQAGAKTGLGRNWRAAGAPKLNSRVTALAAIAELGDGPHTEMDIMKALAGVKEHLGSGTPRSYFRAFVASGYLVSVADAE